MPGPKPARQRSKAERELLRTARALRVLIALMHAEWRQRQRARIRLRPYPDRPRKRGWGG